MLRSSFAFTKRELLTMYTTAELLERLLRDRHLRVEDLVQRQGRQEYDAASLIELLGTLAGLESVNLSEGRITVVRLPGNLVLVVHEVDEDQGRDAASSRNPGREPGRGPLWQWKRSQS